MKFKCKSEVWGPGATWEWVAKDGIHKASNLDKILPPVQKHQAYSTYKELCQRREKSQVLEARWKAFPERQDGP